jgi:hypothetical protein
MRVPTIDERFVKFLERPTRDRWLAVREALISRADFEPYSPVWQQLEANFAAEAFDRVVTLGEQLGCAAWLSPRFHFLIGVAHLELGNVERANREKSCTRLCLEAILQSGAGTAESPYLSTYPGDCYDVLRALDVEAQGQTLIDHHGVWCDVLTADDGCQYWFDVSDLLQRNPAAASQRSGRKASLAAGRSV